MNKSLLSSKFQLLRISVESKIKIKSVVMVTSALANDGKSFVASGLAESIAMVGHRVVLIETAGRAISLNGQRVPEATGGHVTVIRLSSDESARTASRDEVLSFFEQIRSKFDYAILDIETIVNDGVATSLAGAVDAVIIAVREGRKPGEDDELMIRALRQAKAKVLGVVASSAESINEYELARTVSKRDAAAPGIRERRAEDVPATVLFAK